MPRKKSSKPIPEGLKLLRTLQGHKGVITHLAWTPFGELLATASADNSIRVWASENGGIVSVFETLEKATNDIAWSPAEPLIARATRDGPIEGLDPINLEATYTLGDNLLQKVGRALSESSGAHAIAWSPDGQFLAAESLFSTEIEVWSVANSEPLVKFPAHSGRINSLAYAPLWGLLASGSQDHTVKLWEADTDELIHSFEDHDDAVNQVAWSGDGKILASASADKTVRIWDPRTLQPVTVLKGHTKEVTSVSFSFDHRLLASKSLDATVRLWRCDTWEMLACFDDPASVAQSLKIAFSPRGPYLATLGETDTTIRIWEFDVVALYKNHPATVSAARKPEPRPKLMPRGKFDVFLAHNNKDKQEVRIIAEKLKERGLKPWFDDEQIPPGRFFQDKIQEAIPRLKSAAIFIGPHGLGNYQAMENRALIQRHLDNNEFPVIPVLLPGVEEIPKELEFLRQFDHVSFSNGMDDEQALDQLVWGIKG
jgi:WD40 repeat protein